MNIASSCVSEGTVEGLVRAALSAGAPRPVAEEARRATAARFPGGPAREADRIRAESYFWGVVRRRALSGQAPAIARLIVAASLAAELREAGHAPEVVGRALT